MERIINIGGVDVRMRATARIPFEYRECFGKDLIAEITNFYDANSIADYSVFENLAWLLARKAGEEVHNELPPKDAVGAWLDDFENILAIINAAPEIMELWNDSSNTNSTPRKK